MNPRCKPETLVDNLGIIVDHKLPFLFGNCSFSSLVLSLLVPKTFDFFKIFFLKK
jgi:hypothetical protein